jgi:DNA repair exonuclease SbcCD ATPase subunit
LLTGENPNSGVKAENVSQLSTGDEASYAKLEFEHAGHVVVVTRHLLPEKEQATLVIDGTEAARGDKAVTAHIEQLLGIDSKFISRFVLVAQNEIFAFIEDGPSETDKFFQKLFGTANAEKCQEIIGKQLSKLVIPEVITPSDELAGRVSDMDEELTTLHSQIAELPATAAFIQAQNEQRQVIQDWERRAALEQNRVTVAATIAEQTEKLNAMETACAQYDSDLAAIKEVISGNQEAHTSAKVALNHLATYRKIAKVKDATKKRLAEIAELKASKAAPAELPAGAQDKALQAVQTAEFELDRAAAFISVFTETGVASCPTCHTPVSDLAAETERVKAELPKLSAAVESAVQAFNELKTQMKQRQAWEQEIQKLTAEEQQLRESTKTFSHIEAPAASEDELMKMVSDHENMQKAQLEIEPIAQKAREKKAALAGMLETASAQEAKLAADIQAIAADKAAADLAKATLLMLEHQFAERQQLEKQHTALKFERDSVYAQFETAQKNEQQARKLRDWAAISDTARGALKAAPKLVTKRNLQRLEIAINELLQVFGVDFFVKASNDDSASFIAEFFDGRKQPAKRLSYGQKTVLALAFRVAVNSLFAEQIGLLALDEPTAYLDQQRIRALAPVFEKLREFSTARGLQCLLVTHEMSLAHLFESTVELDA